MGVIDEIKSVASIIQKADNVELYKKILNLQADVMELFQENLDLKNEIRKLNEELELKANLKFEGNLYWLINKSGVKEGPFCSKCWDVEQKLVRHRDNKDHSYTCPNCGMYVETERYRRVYSDTEYY